MAKKINLLVYCFLIFNIAAFYSSFSAAKPRKPATYDYYGSLGFGYLMPKGDVEQLAGSASSTDLNLMFRIKKIAALGLEFTIANLEPEFRHSNNIGYEQDRRFYNIAILGRVALWESSRGIKYRYHHLFRPSWGIYLTCKFGYYYHALIFRILQVQRSLYEENEINFARSGFGYAPGIMFLKTFDFGFGLPLGISLRLNYHLASTKPKYSEYFYYEEDYEKSGYRPAVFPGTLEENYYQVMLNLVIMNIRFLER